MLKPFPQTILQLSLLQFILLGLQSWSNARIPQDVLVLQLFSLWAFLQQEVQSSLFHFSLTLAPSSCYDFAVAVGTHEGGLALITWSCSRAGGFSCFLFTDSIYVGVGEGGHVEMEVQEIEESEAGVFDGPVDKGVGRRELDGLVGEEEGNERGLAWRFGRGRWPEREL